MVRSESDNNVGAIYDEHQFRVTGSSSVVHADLAVSGD
jgi:hypothetical protein